MPGACVHPPKHINTNASGVYRAERLCLNSASTRTFLCSCNNKVVVLTCINVRRASPGILIAFGLFVSDVSSNMISGDINHNIQGILKVISTGLNSITNIQPVITVSACFDSSWFGVYTSILLLLPSSAEKSKCASNLTSVPLWYQLGDREGGWGVWATKWLWERFELKQDGCSN